MDYNEWREKLFEETYPKYEFYQGSIEWKKNETLVITWDNEKYATSFNDFYSEKSIDPIDDLLHWIYSNMPLTHTEESEARVCWDGARFRVVVQRPYGITYAQTIENPKKFKNYGSTEGFTWDLEGSMLIINSHLKGVPATSAISEIEALQEVIDGYYDIDEKISVIIPYYDQSKAIIGNTKIIERIQDEEHGIITIPITSWVKQITGENNHE